MKYVVIGNSAAAVGAVEGIRSRDQSGEIVLLGAENRPAYSRPLISYRLAGLVDDEHMYFRGPDFYDQNGVLIISGRRITRVEPGQKRVYSEVPDDAGLEYERLLVTSGGHPVRPACFAGNFVNMFNFYTWDDAEDMEAYLSTLQRPARAIVAGAGLVGLKAAESLIKLGHQVVVVEAAGRILSSIADDAAAARIQAHLEGAGICFYINNPVSRVNGSGQAISVTLADQTELPCDLIITTAGVKPEVGFLAGSGIEIEGGITVNSHLQSSCPDIYAAGDAARAYDAFAGCHRTVPIWPFAYRQGYCAGINMAGGDMEWKGGPVFNSLPLLGLHIASGGRSQASVEENLEIVEVSRGPGLYRRFVIRDACLEGFILVGDISGAGLFRRLVESRADVTLIKERLAAFNFSMIDLPGNWRQAAAGGGC